ncbi:hypothetical protein BJ170DRAFT_684028 [Xylariales sp. AK1849]|nr:hypothetical protein BJ170DRAFT_684028 [Xylariales sp. AK1849]
MKGISSWLTGKTGTPTTNSTERLSARRTNPDALTGESAVAPTPSSSHSLESPSPSPQPATPDDSTNSSIRDNYFGDSAPPQSKPVAIATPNFRSSASASPVTRYLAPDGRIKEQPAIPGIDVDLDADRNPDQDVDMTTGPGLESAFGRSRQDSFVSAGPKPISMNPNRDHGRARRESLAGSLMNGMSWGGVSVGSYIRDDLMMAGTSPFTGAQSPSYHSSSYVPKMEAEFLRNFVCCDQKLDTMHDLLRHYETQHTALNAQPNRPGVQMGHRLSVSRPSVPNQSIGGRQDSQAFHGQFGFGQQNRGVAGNANGGMGFGSLQMGRLQGGMDNSAQKQSSLVNMSNNDELDAVGDMEMDDAVGPMELDDNTQRSIQQTRQMFGQQQRPQLQLNMSSTGMSQQALRTSSPSTPGAGFGFQNNPTVSSVNTPTLTTQQQLGGRMGAGNGAGVGVDDELSGLGNNANLGDFTAFGNGLQYFIDDPAKRLYSPNSASAQQRLQEQMQQFGLDQSQFGDITDPQQLAVLQRAIGTNPGALVMPREEDKPFRCPVIGCEKAYKNQNGLKYHKQHGHQSQQLHENADGTFSIVNPETSIPYPGEMGMEKEKPHKCEYCNKRYKNLNGLKYHKLHSPACEIAAQAAGLKAALAAGAGNQMGLNVPNMANLSNMSSMSHGLPGIGEDMQM